MSLIFYHAPMSTATMTELVLEELGVPCEKVKLDIKAGDTKKSEFTKLNPNARVPVLVHDGTVIWRHQALPGRDLRRRQGAPRGQKTNRESFSLFDVFVAGPRAHHHGYSTMTQTS